MNHLSRRGNAAIIAIIALVILLAAGIGVGLVINDGAQETAANKSNSTALQRDTLLQPIAMWAAATITEYAKANDGTLPGNSQGNDLITKATGQPEVEAADNFTATPVYRKLSVTTFEIVLPTSELGGTAHLVYPFTAEGKSLAPVPDNAFLQETDRVHDSLEEEPTPGVGN